MDEWWDEVEFRRDVPELEINEDEVEFDEDDEAGDDVVGIGVRGRLEFEDELLDEERRWCCEESFVEFECLFTEFVDFELDLEPKNNLMKIFNIGAWKFF